MATTNSFFNYEWSIGLFELRCSGNENNIWDCSYNITDEGEYCDQHNDTSVFCMRKFITTLYYLNVFQTLANTTLKWRYVGVNNIHSLTFLLYNFYFFLF